jgi:hypothetical protein
MEELPTEKTAIMITTFMIEGATLMPAFLTAMTKRGGVSVARGAADKLGVVVGDQAAHNGERYHEELGGD